MNNEYEVTVITKDQTISNMTNELNALQEQKT